MGSCIHSEVRMRVCRYFSDFYQAFLGFTNPKLDE